MTTDVHADVFVVTATKVETRAVLEVFGAGGQTNPLSIDDRVYFDLGTLNGARVWMTQSAMGAGGLGASLQAVTKGIAALSPAAVIMVGIAFGVSEEKQRVGDVLVTEQLRLYDLQRVGTQEDGRMKILLRDDKAHASPWLLNLMRSSDVTWEGAALHFGTVLTGAKLVDNIDFRDQLRSFDPEAVGGEMEGAGLYVACHDRKVDWILVKAICDFADGQKAKDQAERQALAAKNAATFVHHTLRFVKVDWDTRHGAVRLAAVHAPALLEAGNSSDVATKIVEWRRQCAEQLWRAVLALRKVPKILFDLDYVTEDEYPEFVASDRVKPRIQDITDDVIARNIFLVKAIGISRTFVPLSASRCGGSSRRISRFWPEPAGSRPAG